MELFLVIFSVFGYNIFFGIIYFESLLCSKALGFRILITFFYSKLFDEKMFQCLNRRYNGLHVNICANELLKCFEFKSVFYNKVVYF